MEHDEFIKLFEDKLYKNNTFLKSHHAMKDSLFDTLKSLLLKKNLVIISKSELDKLKS